jgi:hypothetical protein
MVRFVSAVIEEHEGRNRSRFVASVEIRGLQKHYGDVHAVGGVDLSIADGELLVRGRAVPLPSPVDGA